MALDRITNARSLATVGVIAVVAAAGYVAWKFGAVAGLAIGPAAVAQAQAQPQPPGPVINLAGPGGVPVIELTDKQLESIKVAAAGTHVFPLEKDAVGSIDFNEDMSVQVFSPYQGKIISAFAQVGDEVKKGQPLYTIDSPDLVQAESTLIGAAATYDQNEKALLRARRLYAAQGAGGIAEKDLEAAVQAEVSAEGALKAARDAVRVFGKTEAEIDSYVAKKAIDPVLVVNSPIAGIVTARNAQPGLLVQPGNPPAPYSVADMSTVWMLANVPESDCLAIRVGQAVQVSTMANPGHLYDGKITTIGATVDPNLHTMLVRSVIQDPHHELRPNMLANFVISTGAPVTGTAVTAESVVREGDGTMTVWVTTDRRKFTQRVVKLGLLHDSYDQIVEGLNQGELVAAEGAIFLDAMLTASPTD